MMKSNYKTSPYFLLGFCLFVTLTFSSCLVLKTTKSHPLSGVLILNFNNDLYQNFFIQLDSMDNLRDLDSIFPINRRVAKLIYEDEFPDSICQNTYRVFLRKNINYSFAKNKFLRLEGKEPSYYYLLFFKNHHFRLADDSYLPYKNDKQIYRLDLEDGSTKFGFLKFSTKRIKLRNKDIKKALKIR